MNTQQTGQIPVTRVSRDCPRFQDFCQRRVATVPPAHCDYKVGDVVTVTNGYGIEIEGVRILGFEKQIDPDWRPDSFIFLDWDCYWFGVSPIEIKPAALQ